MDYLNSLNSLGSVPGLYSINELLKRLDNPQKDLQVIHIAGTNGKGSVGAFIDKILVSSGYKTGRYSSPAVMDPNEIIRLSEQNIDVRSFEKIIADVKLACDLMVADGLNHPTRFEVETAAAILFFKKHKVDYAIIECGMGGLLDATNVFDKVCCSVITKISLDHTAFLGNTLEEITAQKAGIIKKGCKVITNNKNSSVIEIIKTQSLNKNAELITTSEISDIITTDDFGMYFTYKNIRYKSGLIGVYQAENAALAIETVKALDIGISDIQIKNGLEITRWDGRFEKISDNPIFIVDGAHNPDGAKALADSIEKFFGKNKLTFLIGIFKDKDIYGILDKIMKFASNVVVIETPNSERAMNAEVLAEIIKSNYDVPVCYFKDVATAVKYCYEITSSNSAIIAFGSLSNLKNIKNEVFEIDNRRA